MLAVFAHQVTVELGCCFVALDATAVGALGMACRVGCCGAAHTILRPATACAAVGTDARSGRPAGNTPGDMARAFMQNIRGFADACRVAARRVLPFCGVGAGCPCMRHPRPQSQARRNHGKVRLRTTVYAPRDVITTSTWIGRPSGHMSRSSNPAGCMVPG